MSGLVGRRNVPTVINRAYGAAFFWDGRDGSLEHQVVQPLLDPREMAMTPEAVVAVSSPIATLRGAAAVAHDEMRQHCVNVTRFSEGTITRQRD
jgi:cytochrome c peroxidase